MEILDDLDYKPAEQPKKRHGCITAWLILAIVANVFGVFGNLYFVFIDSIDVLGENSKLLLGVLAIGALLNIVFVVLLFQWKKVGFYGFLGTSIAAFVVNMMLNIGILHSLVGLAGIVILYFILQMKANDSNVSAWEALE